MSDQGTVHEINAVLVAEIDAFADMVEQRNLARDAAVCLEQELAAAEAETVRLRSTLAAIVAQAHASPYFDMNDAVRLADAALAGES